MRIFKTKFFAKFALREDISDASLAEAVKRAGKGLGMPISVVASSSNVWPVKVKDEAVATEH